MNICFFGIKQLLEKYGCELHIVVTNLSRMCSEYCNPKTCPNIPVRDAVRMSMSFPGRSDEKHLLFVFSLLFHSQWTF